MTFTVWDPTVPSETSDASSGNDAILEFADQLTDAIPSIQTRARLAKTSAQTFTPLVGALALETTRGRLYTASVKSAGITLGHTSMVVHDDGNVYGTVWQSETGSKTATDWDSNVTMLKHSFSGAYNGVPFVTMSTETTYALSIISAVNASGFSSFHSWINPAPAVDFVVHWTSEGTRDE